MKKENANAKTPLTGEPKTREGQATPSTLKTISMYDVATLKEFIRDEDTAHRAGYNVSAIRDLIAIIESVQGSAAKDGEAPGVRSGEAETPTKQTNVAHSETGITHMKTKKLVWIMQGLPHGNGGWYGMKRLSSKRGMMLERALSIKNPFARYARFNDWCEHGAHSAIRICSKPDANCPLFIFNGETFAWEKV